MPTYLLTWNPKQWHWWDDLTDVIQKKGDYYYDDWSCGQRKDIHPNDRVFLMRQGEEPRGIVASGYSTSDVWEADHWNETKANEGKRALYIDVRFDVVLNPAREEIFPRKRLKEGVLGKMHWDSEMSGIRIPDDVTLQLEEEWQAFLGSERQHFPVAEPFAVEGLKTETISYNRGRSRTLRDLALRESNGVCAVCEIDYSKLLSGKGMRVLQVHHIKQLAADDTPRLTHLGDLAVVCANCHMLIHMNPKQALSVNALKEMLGI